MIIVPPITVTAAKLTATNVAITETLWTAGTYTLGQQRYIDTTLYQVIVASTTDSPLDGIAKDPPTWAVVGGINRFAMFDFRIGRSTSRASPISVTVTPASNELANGVALFDIAGANTVRVRMVDPVEGTVYDRTRDLADYTGINNWFAYFFSPYNLASDTVFLDLPAYVGAAIMIDVTGGGTVSVGEVVLGRITTTGSTAINTVTGIEDFSRKQRDDFGNFAIEERRFAKTATFDILLENSQVNATFRTLADNRAKPALYVGGEAFAETYVLGFFRDFAILRQGPVTSELSIEIEGLT